MKSVAVCLLLLAVCVSAGPLSTRRLSRTTKGAVPDKCCLPGRSFQVALEQVIASWDVHGEAAGWIASSMQVDDANNLLYTHQQRWTPTPKTSTVEMWLTPGALQDTWYQFLKISGSPDCYVRNLTRKPDVFGPICFGPPHAYEGDIVVGTQRMSVWYEPGTTRFYNKTHVIQMDPCYPIFEIGDGMNDNQDMEEKLTDFFNWQMSVSDPSKFIPPSSCKPLPPALEKSMGLANRRYDLSSIVLV